MVRDSKNEVENKDEQKGKHKTFIKRSNNTTIARKHFIKAMANTAKTKTKQPRSGEEKDMYILEALASEESSLSYSHG